MKTYKCESFDKNGKRLEFANGFSKSFAVDFVMDSLDIEAKKIVVEEK